MKQLLKMLALIICLALAFAGCGGDEEPYDPETPNEPNIKPEEPAELFIENTVWSVEGVQFTFFDDYSLLAVESGDPYTGTYEWDGSAGYVYIEDLMYYFYVASDSSLYMTLDDGYDYLMYYEGEYIEEEPDPNIQSTDEYDLYTNNDGTYTFNDKVRNVSYNCPQWMTVILGGIGYTTDGVIVADNANGYVVMDNVTNEWTAYQGTSDEYLYDYVDNYVGEFFTELYGEPEDLNYSELEILGNQELAGIEINVWNDSYDIQIVSILLAADDSSIIAVTYFAPYDADAQLDTLYSQVTFIQGPLQ